MALSRRDLITRGAVAGVGVVAAGNLGALFGASPAAAAPRRRGLVPDPDGLLDLPPGFRYSIVSAEGAPLIGQPGVNVPGRFDGTAAFDKRRGGSYLVRNHEQGGSAANPTVGLDASYVYDPGAKGGTSTIELDRMGRVVDEYVSLAGTFNNCAGGLTPWRTWLTCEETEQKIGGAFTKHHGYVFEVDPADRRNNRNPAPITGMGRYAHEAVVVDPATGTCYLTEDAGSPNGLVYRYVPVAPLGGLGSLHQGGALTAMRARYGGTLAPDLSAFTEPGSVLTVEWAPVPDASALVKGSTRKQFDYAGFPAQEGGPITRSRKFEGMWWGNGRAYIVTSFARLSDGSVGEHDGQVWSYHPPTSTLRLEVILAVSPDTDQPGDGPDNITVSPFGGLILAEDGEGVQYLLAVDEQGETQPLARNALNDSEFAGVCFSPDNRTLYASVQTPGTTYAIRGPFRRLGR